MDSIKHDYLVDAKGLACPMPIIRTKKAMNELEAGAVVQVQATDQGSTADLKAWANKAGHDYLGTVEDGATLKHFLRVAGIKPVETHSFPHVVDNEGLQNALENNRPMTIVDVREKAEYDEYHIPEAVSMPLGELEERMNELDLETPVYVVCRTGNRSDLAAQTFAKNGFNQVTNVIPGMSEWNKKGER
ncbi:rhodanese-related sulfurtransferase/TusA-related sulfurtransferase [Alkalihalobacillus xiaoxiensis]|uniref:Rhodanese-related sulfurtransferase/TusA-related sulfurtransferase n=1 Tax=Shouchella xiaoxiensis TaxID=766895 RepID=A0ABS2SRW5_9BACI|nr:sulfurtransferase TusA family protein [Shouchella xiaoxiensis]MBM7837012.1 rhodanese-related sulfurtransferase/TusA-related sulfurtransferase [Shouchella xiaoxiensis]